MNIFFLDSNPRLAAQYHCDSHVCKMTVESAQLLSTALHLNGSTDSRLYKATHKNHPSAIWTRESVRQYAYTLELFAWLLYEYTSRYGKTHACESKLDMFTDSMSLIPDNGFANPPQCMPDEYKCTDVVQAYRNYYIGSKSRFAKWNYSNTPEWYKL
jgi:hypothetical protein